MSNIKIALGIRGHIRGCNVEAVGLVGAEDTGRVPRGKRTGGTTGRRWALGSGFWVVIVGVWRLSRAGRPSFFCGRPARSLASNQTKARRELRALLVWLQVDCKRYGGEKESCRGN